YRLVRTSVDVSNRRVHHPNIALVSRHLESPVLVEVDIERLRGMIWFGMNDKRHPYVRALRHVVTERDGAYKSSPLRDYYMKCQPSNVVEVLGVPATHLSADYARFSP